MVFDTRFCLTQGGPRHRSPQDIEDDFAVFHNGERIHYNLGESIGDAVKRHNSGKASATKLAAQPAVVAAKSTPTPKRQGFASKVRFGNSFDAFKPTKPAA